LLQVSQKYKNPALKCPNSLTRFHSLLQVDYKWSNVVGNIGGRFRHSPWGAGCPICSFCVSRRNIQTSSKQDAFNGLCTAVFPVKV